MPLQTTLSTPIHAVIGAVARTVFSFVPLTPLPGGAVAGYLEGGAADDGVKIGGIAGVVMLLPCVFLGTFIVMFLPGFGPRGAVAAFGTVAAVVFTGSAVYTVGSSIAGGYPGIYLKGER